MRFHSPCALEEAFADRNQTRIMGGLSAQGQLRLAHRMCPADQAEPHVGQTYTRWMVGPSPTLQQAPTVCGPPQATTSSPTSWTCSSSSTSPTTTGHYGILKVTWLRLNTGPDLRIGVKSGMGEIGPGSISEGCGGTGERRTVGGSSWWGTVR